jgi:hypothetical protein
MGRLRSWIRRLERDSQDEQISIPQTDGTVARFKSDAWKDAFVHEAERLRAIHRGEDPGEAHPVTVAKRNAVYPQPFVFDADRQPAKKSGTSPGSAVRGFRGMASQPSGPPR